MAAQPPASAAATSAATLGVANFMTMGTVVKAPPPPPKWPPYAIPASLVSGTLPPSLKKLLDETDGNVAVAAKIIFKDDLTSSLPSVKDRSGMYTAWMQTVSQCGIPPRDAAEFMLYHVFTKVQNVIEEYFKILPKSPTPQDVCRLLLPFFSKFFKFASYYSIFGCVEAAIGLIKDRPAPLDKSMWVAMRKMLYETYKDVVKTEMLRTINAYRNGESVDFEVVKTSVQFFDRMCSDIAFLETRTLEEARKFSDSEFFGPYKDAAKAYYINFGRQNVSDGLGVFQKAFDKIQAEEQLFVQGAGSRGQTTKDNVRAIQEVTANAIIGDFTGLLQGEGEDSLFGAFMRYCDNQRESDKQILVSVFKVLKCVCTDEDLSPAATTPFPANSRLKCFENALEKFFTEKCLALCKTFSTTTCNKCDNEIALIDGILDLMEFYKQHLDVVVDMMIRMRNAMIRGISAALRDKKVTKIEKVGTTTDVTSKEITLAEVFSVYIDAVMRGERKKTESGESVPSEDIPRALFASAASLLRQLTDQETFLQSHKALLAKRLMSKGAQVAWESYFVQTLTQLLGGASMLKFTTMLNDIANSTDMVQQFERFCGESKPPIESNVQVLVLTNGSWPAYRADSLVAPEGLTRGMTQFTNFYKKVHTTRKLAWYHALGSATLELTPERGNFTVSGNLYQIALLYTIGRHTTGVTLAALVTASGLPAATVKQAAASFTLAKGFDMVGRRDAAGQPVTEPKLNDDHVLVLNGKFSSKLRKLQLPIAKSQAGSPEAPTETVDEWVIQQRKVMTEACIVRLMKSRQTLLIVDLTRFVIEELSQRFRVDRRYVVERVEDLIKREYLARDDENPSLFRYLA